jgi:hypothetical protein
MIDIHPPEHTPHSWRDFFIHIATIVLGLLIAIGLEQTVEAIHHGHERHQLRDDLRTEAEARVSLLKANVQDEAANTRWLRDCIHVAVNAKPSDGYVTFTTPPAPATLSGAKPENSVWEAAKASGTVALLTPPEIEAWSRVAFQEGRAERDAQSVEDAYVALQGIVEHFDVSPDTLFNPHTPVRLTAAQRDELTRSLGLLIAKEETFNFADAAYEGATNAVLHGALTTEDMEPYYEKAASSIPH